MKNHLLLGLLLVFFVGCSGQQQNGLFSPAALSALHAKPGPHDAVHPMSCGTSDPIFIESTGTRIRTYQCGTLEKDIHGGSTGLAGAISLAVDQTTGNVYAAQTLYGVQNLIFGPSQTGNVAPTSSWIIGGEAFTIATIAADSNGNAWTAQSFNGADYNDQYLYRVNQGDSGSVTPEVTIKPDIPSGVWGYYGLTVGGSNNPWVIAWQAGGNLEIEKFLSTDSGRVAPSRRWHGSNVSSVLSQGSTLAEGNNYVYADNYAYGSQSFGPYISVWQDSDASGNTAPDHTIAGSNTTLVEPSQMQIDHNGNLWVVDAGADSVDEFSGTSFGNVAPMNTFSLGHSAVGLALCHAATSAAVCTSGTPARPRHKGPKALRARVGGSSGSSD